MNVKRYINNLEQAKANIKRLTPDDYSGYISGDALNSLKASDFGKTMRNLNLSNQLDNIYISTSNNKVGVWLHGHKVSVKTFTAYLDKGDLVQAYRSIGIPTRLLSNGAFVKRANNFKEGFKACKLQRLNRTLAFNKRVGANLKTVFKLHDVKPLDRVAITKAIWANKALMDRVFVPLYHKVKATPQRVPLLRGLVVGSMVGFVISVVAEVIKFMNRENGCWLYPRFISISQEACKVKILTCDRNAREKAVTCSDTHKGEGSKKYLCFQPATFKHQCKRFHPTQQPLCSDSDKNYCSWACAKGRICVPDDKTLKCVNYTFWEAFSAVTTDAFPNLNLTKGVAIVLVILGCFITMSWLLSR